ncbi:unnamed protein product [Thlaspi arvense]|uniref:NB-ARC domain-containing protein n=1 Tax=Thlaspi arvense TaxID=13288 RepID=A0AAU9RNA4_THLAR|nr:unnamed protein product [Thlaspi arvense]
MYPFSRDENEFIISITEKVKKVIRILEEQQDAPLFISEKLNLVDTDAKSDANPEEADDDESVRGEATMHIKSRKDHDGPNPRKDDNFLGEANSDAIPKATMSFSLKEDSFESVFVTSIVEEVNKALSKISFQEVQNPETTGVRGGRGDKPETFPNKDPLFGMEQRMEKLEQKLQFYSDETRIIGVVGMPGIGKTTLALMLHEKWNCKFVRCVPLLNIRKKSNDYGPAWLRTTLLKLLLGGEVPIINDETTHESVTNELLETKVFVVLDDVSDEKQFEFLLGDLKWLKKGSKIVITTCDKSLLEGLAHDIYLVPQMDNKEAFQLFSYHALDDQDHSRPPRKLLTRSRISVNKAGGNPLALKLMGSKFRGKDKSHSDHKPKRQTQCSTTNVLNAWKFYIDRLSEQQKDVFLDIVWLFKSEDEYFVWSILDSGDHDSTDPGAVSEVRDLVNKSLITISDSRVEMNYLVYMSVKKWVSSLLIVKTKSKEPYNTRDRGIFLDMSKVRKCIALKPSTFTSMSNLRYLKIYDSYCHQQCKPECKLNFPHGLEFPLKEVRYLHWINFQLEELSSDFMPDNLVDLRLPYSNIKRVWEGVKDTSKLKWVDLSHSCKLLNIAGLSNATNIQRLNLEGCAVLDELPSEIQNMNSLVFLNLRGCTGLSSLPEINLTSLKFLILSDCSNLKEFQLVSESVEFLHLDGTAISKLPPSVKNLQRLVLLNLKNCKSLECIPNCLSKLKNLEELILSGCSRLKNLPDVKHSMKHIQILRLDTIGAEEMPDISSFIEGQASRPYCNPSEWPHGVNEVSSLGRLCLSGNDFISLQADISKLYNLRWLDVKQCKKLRSIPMLPPRLQYFDAHGCDSLERVSNPLALQVLTEHNQATSPTAKNLIYTQLIVSLPILGGKASYY